MKNNVIQTTSIVVLSILVSTALVPSVSAETVTLEITGNGAESANAVSQSQSNNTNVSSNNNATVNNDINITANTGNNSTDNNTGGESNITTGDIKTDTAVSTTANVSNVTTGCCESQSSTTTIAGNGTGSNNAANNNHAAHTNVSVNNSASIENNVNTNANTGRNSASNNTGSKVTIKTGDISVKNTISNKANEAKVKVQNGGDVSLTTLLKISGNGAYSENVINYDVNNDVNVKVNNITDLLNNVKAVLNTGDNVADDNVGGKVKIITGDIDIQTIIDNLVNINIVEVVCGCDKTPEKPEQPEEEKPGQPEAPTPSTNVGGPGGPGNSTNSSSSSPTAAATMLPVTGNNLLYFFMLANIMMLILGTYLRLRAGRSPGYTFAI